MFMSAEGRWFKLIEIREHVTILLLNHLHERHSTVKATRNTTTTTSLPLTPCTTSPLPSSPSPLPPPLF